MALDGLRGVAVLAVLASHAFAWAHGGFLGVDVFFVLSGYLITSLLLHERERTGEIDFLGFYRRRAARLAPAYLLMLAIAIPIMAWPLAGTAQWPVPLAVAASAGYAANWVSVANVDALGPIVHTWSLSIEEQFYLLWPAAFAALSRNQRSLRRWLGAGIVVVVLARLIGWELTGGIWPYFATITHADGLLAGALLAVLMANRPVTAAERRRSGLAAAAGVAVLGGLGSYLAVVNGATYTVGLTLAVAATAVVVRHAVIEPIGRLARALSWRPLVGVGRISYGLYLYHMPIFQLVQARRLGFAPTLILEVGGTFAIALASWFAIEKPAQRWARTTVLRPLTRRIAVRAVASASRAAGPAASSQCRAGAAVATDIPALVATPVAGQEADPAGHQIVVPDPRRPHGTITGHDHGCEATNWTRSAGGDQTCPVAAPALAPSSLQDAACSGNCCAGSGLFRPVTWLGPT